VGPHGSADQTPLLDFGEEMEKGGEGKKWEGKERETEGRNGSPLAHFVYSILTMMQNVAWFIYNS